MADKEGIFIKQTDRYIRYVLERSQDFSNIEYKVLLNQKEQGFLECSRLMLNGQLNLVYDTSLYSSMGNILSNIGNDEFFGIIMELFQKAAYIKNNGFMKSNHVDIHEDRIFIDKASGKIYLIYLPVSFPSDEKQEAFEEIIRIFLLRIIQEHRNLQDNSLKLLMDDLKVKDYSLEVVKNKILNGIYKANVLQNDYLSKKRITLVSCNLQESIKICVDKEIFYIGKRVNPEHGLIRNYPTVSREHCKIICRAEQFFIVDLGSANGTYINERRVPDHKEIPLYPKDRLRLANICFDVIEEEA